MSWISSDTAETSTMFDLLLRVKVCNSEIEALEQISNNKIDIAAAAHYRQSSLD